jgi:hypothetical protein
LKEKAHANFNLTTRFAHQAFAAFGTVIAQVFKTLLIRVERACDTLHHHTRASANIHGCAARVEL